MVFTPLLAVGLATVVSAAAPDHHSKSSASYSSAPEAISIGMESSVVAARTHTVYATASANDAPISAPHTPKQATLSNAVPSELESVPVVSQSKVANTELPEIPMSSAPHTPKHASISVIPSELESSIAAVRTHTITTQAPPSVVTVAASHSTKQETTSNVIPSDIESVSAQSWVSDAPISSLPKHATVSNVIPSDLETAPVVTHAPKSSQAMLSEATPSEISTIAAHSSHHALNSDVVPSGVITPNVAAVSSVSVVTSPYTERFANSSVNAVTATSSQPWQFRILSENWVPAVASLRKEGVPAEVASSVAKHLIDDGLKPTQYTSLMRQGFDMFNSDGYYPNATSLYNFATGVDKAYSEIHTEISYWSYVEYARSAQNLFETSKWDEAVSAAATNTRHEQERKLQSSFYSKIYSSLSSDPTGSAALETLSKVADNYNNDFDPPRGHVSMVEQALMKMLGVL